MRPADPAPSDVDEHEPTTIVELVVDPDALRVEWSDGQVAAHLWLWLRDHSHDDVTMHPTTMQRQLFTAGVDPALRGTDAVLEHDRVVVHWSDLTQSPSIIPVDFLREHCEPLVGSDLHDERMLWDGASIVEHWPTIGHDEVMGSDDALAEWLDRVARFGFCFVTDVPTDPVATDALIRRVGYVRETVFGGMWDFQADLAKADTAYTSLELRPHTDGTYSQDAPGLQLLHCLAFNGDGGESTMVDGFRVAAQLRMTDPSAYDVLSSVSVPGQYIGDGVHLRAERPVFRHRRDGVLEQVSLNNHDRAPFSLPLAEMAAFYSALRALETLVNDQRFQWQRVMQPGDAMVFDNWRVLHGRLAYSGHRHLAGGYVNREDYESRRRMLARV
ncbi:MAG: TauD/TfdA family dioxygenase [Ilumatobacteraceae bacterium]